MKITSTAFENGGVIPAEYTCDGVNKNPPLSFEAVPPTAKSLVLIMEDPDVPKDRIPSGTFDHWIVYNISPKTTGVVAHTGMAAAGGDVSGGGPLGTVGTNSGGHPGYTGPCPPEGEHRYFFRLHALDTQIALKKGAKKAEVIDAMEGHIKATTEIMGKYKKLANI